MASEQIAQLLAVVCELTNTRLSDGAMEMIVDELSTHRERAVLAALHRCASELRGVVTLAAILDRIDDGHPGAESAWAAVACLTDADSVVWTEDMALCYGSVRALLLSGDAIGARMAFLEAYRRRVSAARVERRAPVWSASLGFDASHRTSVLDAAVRDGRLRLQDAQRYLSPHEWPVSWSARMLASPNRPALADIRDMVQRVLDHVRRPRDGAAS